MLSLVTVELQLRTERDRDQGIWPRDPDEFMFLLHARMFGTARVLAQDPIPVNVFFGQNMQGNSVALQSAKKKLAAAYML